jgi:hypothetical protein
MKTWGSGGIAPPFSTSALHGGKRSASHPLPLYPRGKRPRFPLDQRLDGPQSRSGRCGEEKILNCQDSHTDRPASRYTDWVKPSYWTRCLLYRIQINIPQYVLYQVILFSWMSVRTMSHVMRRKSAVLCTTWLVIRLRSARTTALERVSYAILGLLSLVAGRRPYFGNGCEYEN